jgi:hypothetical protein
MGKLSIKVFLFHGTEQLAGTVRSTAEVAPGHNPRWMTWLKPPSGTANDVIMSTLPLETRVAFILYGHKLSGKAEPLAWVTQQLIDDRGHLVQGASSLRMWVLPEKPTKAHKNKDLEKKKEELKKKEKAAGIVREEDLGFIYRGTNRDHNGNNEKTLTLSVRFDEFLLPIVAPLVEPYIAPLTNSVLPPTPIKVLTFLLWPPPPFNITLKSCMI